MIHNSNLDGENISSAELEINSEIKSRYIKIRYVNTVGGSGCQFIEIGALGWILLKTKSYMRRKYFSIYLFSLLL